MSWFLSRDVVAGDEETHRPRAVVCCLRARDASPSSVLPVLFVEAQSGEVALSKAAFLWARESLRKHSLSTIEDNVRILARLINFYSVWSDERTQKDNNPDYVVYEYLNHRRAGTRDSEGVSHLPGLTWWPVSATTLKSEFSALSGYFRFCATALNYIDLPPRRFPVGEIGAAIERLDSFEKLKDRDFLGHLSAARRYWQNRYGERTIRAPALIQRTPKARNIRRFPTEEEVWAVIEAERNPVYRGLWLVAAFGGIRISEQLNAWQIDILPGSYRKAFFGAAESSRDETILFLRADPCHSRYVEDVGVSGPTRHQYLIRKYGSIQLPRNLRPKSDPLRAGWKSTLYIGNYFTSQVFWIDRYAAYLFSECAAEIREWHRRHQTSKQHPWYYVNVASLKEEFLGQPTRIGRVEAALEAAYRRVRLQPHAWGRNIQGFRHFYKAYAEEELGMGRKHIQIMLGHHHPGAQDDYGKDARAAHEKLSAVLGRRTTAT